ncbi:helix-hairpin-helix domain-containing protein [Kribbella sp. NPDC026611]|uniref:helix-hairpin-helix domain-containing protein n=1 Tax=Kribbella sp. NPDC026611 TaxID=3154911 RepID=UPI0033FDF210
MSTTYASDLTSLMNVGPAVARYLALADVTRVDQLAGRDALELFETICERGGERYDPCLLDTIMSAVDQANGEPARAWWTYTTQRKKLLS